jgi:hypothetical protein
MAYLDSRDLEKELEELEEREEDKDYPLSETEQQELKELKELKEECENCGWDYGICFIPDYEFEDYCRELADDCYSLDNNNPLSNHIDWESWANACDMDYSDVDFRGTTYKYREA